VISSQATTESNALCSCSLFCAASHRTPPPRRNEAPIALIEMFDALLSLDPSLSAKQKRKRSYEIMARALQRLERKDA
jgi:hypothetical protein